MKTVQDYRITDSEDNYETERDKKFSALVEAFESNRTSVNRFFRARGFDGNEVKQDADFVEDKEYEMLENAGMVSSLDTDKALEAILFYMGSSDQIFNRESYTEPGSDYDDFVNGVDIIFGFPNEGSKYDTVFSIDACSATLPEPIAKKFKNIEKHSRDNTPGCNRIKYFEHGGKFTHLNCTPNYVVGTMPSHVSSAVDAFELKDGIIQPCAIDEDLRKKILIEILLQSQTGALACNLVEEPDNFTERAKTSHKRIHAACTDALYQIFGIDKEADKANEEFDKAILESFKTLASDDLTFKYICNEARSRRATVRELVHGKRMRRAEKTRRRAFPESHETHLP